VAAGVWRQHQKAIWHRIRATWQTLKRAKHHEIKAAMAKYRNDGKQRNDGSSANGENRVVIEGSSS